MRSQAEQDWSREEQRIRASVEGEKQSILAAAEQEIAAATSHAQKALQQFAAELAIEQAARKLVVSAETDRLLVQSFAHAADGRRVEKGTELMASAAPRYAHAFAQVAEASGLDAAVAQQQLRDFAEMLAGSSELREVTDEPID